MTPTYKRNKEELNAIKNKAFGDSAVEPESVNGVISF